MQMLLKLRGERVNLILLARERIRGLLFHVGFKDKDIAIRDKVVAIKAKARLGLLAN